MQQETIPLDQIQKWMQSVISHPEGIATGVDSPAAQEQIPVTSDRVEDVVTRSQSLSSLERLQIYGHAYYSRLVECLRDEFPAIAHALTEELFDAFAMGYLQHYPSQSYTLGQLGAKFPQFLSEVSPLILKSETSEIADFLVDLADLERTYSEVFDGPGVEDKPLLDPQSLREIPPEDWPNIRLVPVPCLRLKQYRYPIHEYITAVRHEESATIPALETTYLAITRREFIVRRVALSFVQFELLTQLATGKPLGESIEIALENTDADFDELANQLQSWFQDWTSWQFFAGIKK